MDESPVGYITTSFLCEGSLEVPHYSREPSVDGMPEDTKTEMESQRHADVITGIINDLEVARNRAREIQTEITSNREHYRKLDDLREAGGRAGRRKQLDDELTKMQTDLQHQKDLIDDYESVLEDERQEVSQRQESQGLAGERGSFTESPPQLITQPPSPIFRIPESQSDESREGGAGGEGQPGGPQEGDRSDQSRPESAFRTRETIRAQRRDTSSTLILYRHPDQRSLLTSHRHTEISQHQHEPFRHQLSV